MALPVVLPGLPLYGLGRVACCAEAGHDLTFSSSKGEHLRVGAVQVVAGREIRFVQGVLYLTHQALSRGGPRHAPHRFLLF